MSRIELNFDWYNLLNNAEKTCIQDKSLRKVHYLLGDGNEFVEEYNMDTGVVNRRAWKRKDQFRKIDQEWDIEIGDPEPGFDSQDLDKIGIRESNTSPLVSRRNTKHILEWRIRNLPYPISTYLITVSSEERAIIIRTTNKKYFKKLPIPDLDRAGLPFCQNNLEFSHKYNTLIIGYKKPEELIKLENKIFNEIVMNQKVSSGGLSQCNPS